MTYTVRTRGAGGYLVAEYICHRHGIFESLVQRDDDGNAPDMMLCPVEEPAFSDLPDGMRQCLERSPWTVSAVHGRVKRGEVAQGKYEPPPTAAWMDTRELGEGMPLGEWQTKREAMWEERREREVREETK